jgi:hypothetical protein
LLQSPENVLSIRPVASPRNSFVRGASAARVPRMPDLRVSPAGRPSTQLAARLAHPRLAPTRPGTSFMSTRTSFMSTRTASVSTRRTSMRVRAADLSTRTASILTGTGVTRARIVAVSPCTTAVRPHTSPVRPRIAVAHLRIVAISTDSRATRGRTGAG